ncbi:MAG: ribonuclease HIII [Candidatus Margulisiibacteriota bacterium]|jgi:ribonuclease HIII
MNKFEYYQKIKEKLSDFELSNYQEINYGLQFEVKKINQKGIIRIYESKKGVKLDFSQIKDKEFLDLIINFLDFNDKKIAVDLKTATKNLTLAEPLELIGIDESGKGDFFGPLVIAACFTNNETANILKERGVLDSKRLTEVQIIKYAKQIHDLCPYAVLVINPKKYNDLHKKYHNINEILAHSHINVLEKVMSKVDCKIALSDQFANENLLLSKLKEKNITVNLIQRPRAENHPAVAAASILARFQFITEITKLREKYHFSFALGASDRVKNQVKTFRLEFGEAILQNVCKIHFIHF